MHGYGGKHIRESFNGHITLDELRDAWSAISPPHYIERYASFNKKTLFIYARYDTTFPLRFSEQVVEKAKELGMDHKAVALPCGHYTVGKTPFKFLDGYHICSYLKRNL